MSAPEYNFEELSATSVLLSHYNKFDLFVEDENCVTLYAKLVEIVDSSVGKNFTPIPLLGRDNVIRAAQNDNDTTRKKLYIVDGDYQFVLGSVQDRINNLYYLNCYSIENIICSTNSLAQTLSLIDGKKGHEYYINSDYFASLSRMCAKYLLPISVYLCVLAANGFSGETCKRKFWHLLDYSGANVRLKRNLYVRYVRNLMNDVDNELGNDLLNLTIKRTKDIVSSGVCWQKYIIGKSNGFYIFKEIVKHLGGHQLSDSMLRGLLTPHCDFSNDDGLLGEVKLRAG